MWPGLAPEDKPPRAWRSAKSNDSFFRGADLSTWQEFVQAGRLNIPFATLTELAAEAIRGLPLVPTMNVNVLFDAYYLCSTVARAEQYWGDPPWGTR